MFLGSLIFQTLWKNVEQKECIVLGDFNFDILKLVGSSRVWLELMESFNYSHEFHNTLQPLLTISFLILLTTSHLLVYHNTLSVITYLSV